MTPRRQALLAEDHPIQQALAVELLHAAGWQVTLAGDGRQAVKLAQPGRFDLVLMDLCMPVLDGLAAARDIRARLGPGLPIVLLSADAPGPVAGAAFDDWLLKPLDLSALHRVLVRWGPSGAVAAPLVAVDGLDLPMALRNLGGQPDSVERLLRRFVQHYRDGLPALREPLAPAGCRPLADACHALRGACVTLGLLPLGRRLAALERRLTAEAVDVPAAGRAARRVNGLLQRTVARLDAALTS